jgi:PhzF family phenazine biosynthesis protein
MGLSIIQVDAFASSPFTGNPAAVCLMSEPQPEDWMQKVAQEMNLSETAFLHPQEDGFGLRWFTPKVEVDLCGHATLASAHVLWTEGYLPLDQPARFHTRSGLLTAQRQDQWIELDFPATVSKDTRILPTLIKALNVPIREVYENSLGYLVEVDSEACVRQVQPNFSLLRELPVHGVIVTSLGDQSGYDFVSRYFAPAVGINEDPVTGSAHCCLGPFWRDRLDQTEFLAYQASARGGELKVRCVGDRVMLGGQSITVLRGELVSL